MTGDDDSWNDGGGSGLRQQAASPGTGACHNRTARGKDLIAGPHQGPSNANGSTREPRGEQAPRLRRLRVPRVPRVLRLIPPPDSVAPARQSPLSFVVAESTLAPTAWMPRKLQKSDGPPCCTVLIAPSLTEIAAADTIRILVATDNHVGYAERDPVRGNDSYVTFNEIMELARERDVTPPPPLSPHVVAKDMSRFLSLTGWGRLTWSYLVGIYSTITNHLERQCIKSCVPSG